MLAEIVPYDINNEAVKTLVQWDTDVYLYLKDGSFNNAHDVHFFNSESSNALAVHSEYDDGVLKVKIPNKLLKEYGPLFGYVYAGIDDGYRSIRYFKITVRKCPIPTDYSVAGTEDYAYVTGILKEIAEYAATVEESRKDVIASVAAFQNYLSQTAASYQSSYVICDGEIPARRVRTILEINCYHPEQRAIRYAGVDFDGGTPAGRALEG